MEPPRHNDWEAKRATNKQEREAILEIKGWIKESLKALVPDLDSEVVNEDSIADLLPDEELPGPNDAPPAESDLGGIPSRPEALNRPVAVPPATRIAGKGRRARGEKGPGGEGAEVTDPKAGDQRRTGGRKARRGGEGGEGGGAAKTHTQIDLRSYRDEPESPVYQLIARTSDDYSGDLLIDAVTEDGSSVPCALEEARDSVGKSLPVSGNKIGGIELKKDESMRLSVKLTNAARLALRATTT